MSSDLFLIGGLVAPVLLLTILRINAVMVFMSLCLGSVLVHFVAGAGTNSLLKLLEPYLASWSTSAVQLGVLLLPAVLTGVFMVFSIHGRGKVLLNILPSVGVGLLAVLLVVPVLPSTMPFTIQSQPLWHTLTDFQSIIVAASAGVSLFFLWSQRQHGRAKEGR